VEGGIGEPGGRGSGCGGDRGASGGCGRRGGVGGVDCAAERREGSILGRRLIRVHGMMERMGRTSR